MMRRIIDVIVSVVALVLLFPIGVIVALCVKLTSKGPVLHWSDRMGLNGRLFSMPKFRSMWIGTPDVESNLLVKPEQRMTPIGGFIRRTSLDEIPQLLSVLKGDMTLIGPRPALFNQEELISSRSSLGLDVLKPGITGWAQVNGRDNIALANKIELDFHYYTHRSFLLDIKIIGLTIVKVLGGSGVNH